jgi:hypothetical protein
MEEYYWRSMELGGATRDFYEREKNAAQGL